MLVRWVGLFVVMMTLDDFGGDGEALFCRLSAWCPSHIGAAWHELVRQVYAIPVWVILGVMAFILLSLMTTVCSGILFAED
jgi:hypothetical protein